MESVFVDSDVLLDLMIEREPFYAPAAILFTMAEDEKIKACVSSLSLANAHYILRKLHTESNARKIISRVKLFTTILPLDEKIIDLSLVSDFHDFEDALQYNTALENKTLMIITRNLSDFRKSKIPVMTAESYIKSIIN